MNIPFHDGAPYQRHSETSKDAADSIVDDLPRLQKRVYERLLWLGSYGATDEQIQIALSMNPSTQRPRRIELTNKGLVHAVEGPNGKRLTRSGRKAQVWAT